jgi:hypothetical protein
MRSLESSSIGTVTNFDWPTRIIDVIINIAWVGVGECYRNINRGTYLSAERIGFWPVVCEVVEPQHKFRQRRGEYRTREKVASQYEG